ncbi:GNAT family N-acetyltransferase [Saccharothrix sp. ST-888]|uniref:GNAT family N-acetyltransferase n=1 Tax=Saccharothrix sp. ST-888 TaxID=1427391 RepID=UPI0005EC0235|nr:GNAT family protein [Saccharothrix sp. ST-888]KJK57624.1 GCN5 family acetyltransferase [Saccharothrix sp. ST-888]
MTAKPPAPVTLTGTHVRLEPFDPAHLADLFEAAGRDEEVWRWVPVAVPQSEQQLADLVRSWQAKGFLPFAVIGRQTGRVIGLTCYLDVSVQDERLEIGGTFYARSVWRTAVNTESKLLLLTHAFEELGMGRVCWKTDRLNERSQNAIRRLGAQYEGTHRREKRRADGTFRDTVYFSMLREEWPAAKLRLTERLAAGQPPTG